MPRKRNGPPPWETGFTRSKAHLEVPGMDAVRAPWERQKGETRVAFEAFIVYRDSMERTLAKTGAALGKSTNLMKRWSYRWNWVDRCMAWDIEVDRIRRESMLKEIEAMNQRHIAEAMALQQKAIERLRGVDPADLNPNQVLAYLTEAAKMERVARGIPDRVQQEVSGPDGGPVEVSAQSGLDLSRLTEEELRALASIRRRLAGSAE